MVGFAQSAWYRFRGADHLGFGVASLLHLVTEELLAEAHKVPNTPIVTPTFFAGFLVPIVIAAI